MNLIISLQFCNIKSYLRVARSEHQTDLVQSANYNIHCILTPLYIANKICTKVDLVWQVQHHYITLPTSSPPDAETTGLITRIEGPDVKFPEYWRPA